MRIPSSIILSCIVITVAMALPVVLAHAPLEGGDGETLDTASEIPDPSKSWAIYSELHEPQDAHYYYLEMGQNERIFASLITSPESKESGFIPSMILMGPGLSSSNEDEIPSFVEKLNDSNVGIMVISGNQPEETTYEPFSPSCFYDLASIDLTSNQSGRFYIIVFNEGDEGRYGLAVGYKESYTISEWILLPFDLLNVYQWEGQHILFILAPFLFIIVFGIIGFYWKSRKGDPPKNLTQWLGGISGLLILGTGATVFFQMGYVLSKAPFGAEVIVTIMFAVIPILIALAIMRLSFRDVPELDTRRRVMLAVLGILAIFAWAGYIVGPALAIVASVMPSLESRISGKDKQQ